MNEARDRHCRRFEDDLLLLSSGELDALGIEELEAHLRSCESCRELSHLSAKAVEGYATLPTGDISDADWRRMLTRATRSEVRPAARRERRVWQQLAAGLLLFVLGVWSGKAGFTKDAVDSSLESRLVALETHVLVSQLRPASSSERLAALDNLVGRPSLPQEAWSALLRALESDPSPNVRLAVVDVLRTLQSLDPVVAQLAELLPRQESEIVAAELVELAAERRLHELSPALDRLVRTAASERLRKLSEWALAEMGSDV